MYDYKKYGEYISFYTTVNSLATCIPGLMSNYKRKVMIYMSRTSLDIPCLIRHLLLYMSIVNQVSF